MPSWQMMDWSLDLERFVRAKTHSAASSILLESIAVREQRSLKTRVLLSISPITSENQTRGKPI